MKTTILLIAVLTACGQPPQQNAPATEESTGGVERAPDAPKEIVVEYRKDGTSYAIAVSDTSELPQCEHGNSKQLAWVKTTNQFFSCEDLSWVEIPVKGEKGDKGDPGETGAEGAKGEIGQTASVNEWTDPILAQRWFVTSARLQSHLASFPPCSAGWRLATRLELREAVNHGLPVFANSVGLGFPSFWTSESTVADPNTPDTLYRYTITTSGAEGLPALNTTAAVACMRGGI